MEWCRKEMQSSVFILEKEAVLSMTICDGSIMVSCSRSTRYGSSELSLFYHVLSAFGMQ